MIIYDKILSEGNKYWSSFSLDDQLQFLNKEFPIGETIVTNSGSRIKILEYITIDSKWFSENIPLCKHQYDSPFINMRVEFENTGGINQYKIIHLNHLRVI